MAEGAGRSFARDLPGLPLASSCPGQGMPAPLWMRPSCSDCPWQSCLCREQSRHCHLLGNTLRRVGRRCRCPCPCSLLDHCPFLPTCALLLWGTGCPAFLSPLLLAWAFWGPKAPSCTHRRVYQRVPVFLPVTTSATSTSTQSVLPELGPLRSFPVIFFLVSTTCSQSDTQLSDISICVIYNIK